MEKCGARTGVAHWFAVGVRASGCGGLGIDLWSGVFCGTLTRLALFVDLSHPTHMREEALMLRIEVKYGRCVVVMACLMRKERTLRGWLGWPLSPAPPFGWGTLSAPQAGREGRIAAESSGLVWGAASWVGLPDTGRCCW